MSFAILKGSPALRFILMENQDARFDQGYKFRPVARKTGIAVENSKTKPDRTNAIFHGRR